MSAENEVGLGEPSHPSEGYSPREPIRPPSTPNQPKICEVDCFLIQELINYHFKML